MMPKDIGRASQPEEGRDLHFREAQERDERLLLEWKNDEGSREQSFSSHIVTEEEHHAWFRRVLERPDVKLLILSLGATPVGSMRFDCRDDWAEISYSIDCRYRGSGIGRRLIGMACDWGAGVLRLSQLRAYVKPGNLPSQKVLLENGFRQTGAVEAPPGLLFSKDLHP